MRTSCRGSVERYNRLLSAQVAALNDPRVRFVSLEPAMAKLGDVSKDGWHFTPDAHRVIATMLADEVEALVQ
jgi:lysophospholipase L1-like esterase